MKFQRLLAVWCVLACCGAAANLQQGGEVRNAPEIWGGMHVSMTRTVLGATLEFDCAHGNLSQPITPNAKGEFSVPGTYTPEAGGPVQRDNLQGELPATYKGVVSGNTMTLEIVLNGQNRGALPTLTLTQGKTARLVKCR